MDKIENTVSCFFDWLKSDENKYCPKLSDLKELSIYEIGSLNIVISQMIKYFQNFLKSKKNVIEGDYVLSLETIISIQTIISKEFFINSIIEFSKQNSIICESSNKKHIQLIKDIFHGIL
jgi:hypothetical protein